jgi:23S rRNA (uracil1939-C5)-methyltransferase
MDKIEVTFEKMGHNGISLGRHKGKIVFAFGVLPQEKAKIRIIKEKKNFIFGEIEEILKKSTFRVRESEDHYLSCSPWQVFDYQYQLELKKNILREIYQTFAKENVILTNFFSSPKIFEYRTKIEYSFLEENNRYFYAFYKRGSHQEKIKLLNLCKLIASSVNEKAQDILEEINKAKLKNLKTLIIRKSQRFDDVHFSLLTWDKNQKFNFKSKNLSGFAFIYSRKECPASTFDEVIEEKGQNYLREKILNLEIRYPYNSFFQNNIELFEKVLEVMRGNSGKFNKVVDLYAGVGVIGLALSDFGKEILSVEIDKNATSYAQINAQLNNIENFKTLNLPSEKIPKEILERTDLLILDPPRPGIHKKLIKLILETAPKNIFYLSCNPITQARDFNLLKEKYKIKKLYGFDFYPNTPHLESLLILKKI